MGQLFKTHKALYTFWGNQRFLLKTMLPLVILTEFGSGYVE